MDGLKKPETWFLMMETMLYTAFLLADFHQSYAVGTVLKYLSILLCLWFVTFQALHTGEWTMVAAMTLTAVADGLLLVSGRRYEAGILLFLVVQGIYGVRIGKEGRYTLMIRAALVSVAWAILWMTDLVTGVNLLAGLYFPQLLCNAALALGLKGSRGRLFAVGLLYFVACDVCVGLWNMGGWLPESARRAAGFGIWMLYLPAQVCIALSSRKK